MELLPALSVFSLLRRAAGRIGEAGAALAFLDLIGLVPGFIQAMQDRETQIVSVLVAVGGSILFDIFEIATRPDMDIKTCEINEPELPLG